MEKKMVVAGDVDEEEALSKVFKFVNLLWLHGLIDGETLEAARKISSQYQGYHEHELSYGGEADLLRHYKRCKKNPGHSKFIPLNDFKIEDLPPGSRDNVIFDCIRAEADLTCRLIVKYTSANRPIYYPGRAGLKYPFYNLRDRHIIRTGTGLIRKVDKYTDNDNKPCECDECNRPGTHTPHKIWGKVQINTAAHVVHDDDEARHTTCYFGYDSRTTLLFRCLKLTGLRVEVSRIRGDACRITYATHNMDVINRLDKMWSHSFDLYNKVMDKYGYNMNPNLNVPCPVVIISHPHGHSKHITVGMWTHRKTWGETYKHKEEGLEADMVNAYTYNAHTCPGSSGAPVFMLPEKTWWLSFRHYHSEAGEGNTNNNKSVVMQEIVSAPTRSKNK